MGLGLLLPKRKIERATVEMPSPGAIAKYADPLRFARREGNLPPLAGGGFNCFGSIFAEETGTAAEKYWFYLVNEGPLPIIRQVTISCPGATGFLKVEFFSAEEHQSTEANTERTAQIVRGVESAAAKTKVYSGKKEPKAPKVYEAFQIPQASCPFVIQYPLGDELGPFSAKAKAVGSVWGVCLTTVTTTTTVRASIRWEE